MVGEQYDRSIVFVIPDCHDPKQAKTVLLQPIAGEPNQLVREDVKISRCHFLFDNLVVGVLLEQRDKVGLKTLFGVQGAGVRAWGSVCRSRVSG